MPTATVTLTVTQGSLPRRSYVFEAPARCVIGRAEDCDIRVPSDARYALVSRHHCCLEIEPAGVRVRDLGSRNGTYVNGQNIGYRPAHQRPDEADPTGFPAHELNDGDELEVGILIFRVGVVVPSECLLPV